MATRPFFRKSNSAAAPRKGVRNVMCGTVMEHARSMLATDSMASVLDVLTKHDWDHVFIVDVDGAPMGRIHAVDLLKMVAKKTVNRDIAWMHSIPAQQVLTHPCLLYTSPSPRD